MPGRLQRSFHPNKIQLGIYCRNVVERTTGAYSRDRVKLRLPSSANEAQGQGRTIQHPIHRETVSETRSEQTQQLKSLRFRDHGELPSITGFSSTAHTARE